MEQYISKSALVAEIENLANTYKKCPTFNSYEDGLKDGRQIGYKDALDKINTLEVKEVELEKNSLTWKDISAIRRIMAECRRQISNEMQILNDEELCKEVLKKFKAQKGENNG